LTAKKKKTELPAELEAHVTRELELKEDIDEMLARLEARDYRTKTEKRFLSDQLLQLRRDLSEHLANPPQP
jgi:hypothetical protein